MADDKKFTLINLLGGFVGSIFAIGVAYGIDIQWRHGVDDKFVEVAKQSAETKVRIEVIAAEAKLRADGIEASRAKDHDELTTLVNDVKWIRRKLENGVGSNQELYDKKPY